MRRIRSMPSLCTAFSHTFTFPVGEIFVELNFSHLGISAISLPIFYISFTLLGKYLFYYFSSRYIFTAVTVIDQNGLGRTSHTIFSDHCANFSVCKKMNVEVTRILRSFYRYTRNIWSAKYNIFAIYPYLAQRCILPICNLPTDLSPQLTPAFVDNATQQFHPFPALSWRTGPPGYFST